MRSHIHSWLAGLMLLLPLLAVNPAHAAAVPAYSGKMNTAVGGVIQQKTGKWGFAANDPRVPATIEGVGAAVTTLALGIGGGAVATVGWPALLVAAGISGLVTGAVSLAQGGIYHWLFNSDSTINTSGAAATAEGLEPGYCWGYGTTPTCTATKAQACEANDFTYRISDGGCIRISEPFCPEPGCLFGYPVSKVGTPTSAYPPLTSATPSDAVANVPDAELASPISNEMLAVAANAAWKAMAATQPNALPWSASDPITAADVAQWKAENPSLVPTVADAIAPVAAPSTSSVPIGSTATSTTSGPIATPGTGSQVDLGPDPNIGAPTLETTPTAQQILAPILDLMPTLRNFTVPGHAAACPQPSFTALGNNYTISSHCSLIESNRAIIEAAMMAVWTITAAFIVLRA